MSRNDPDGAFYPPGLEFLRMNGAGSSMGVGEQHDNTRQYSGSRRGPFSSGSFSSGSRSTGEASSNQWAAQTQQALLTSNGTNQQHTDYLQNIGNQIFSEELASGPVPPPSRAIPPPSTANNAVSASSTSNTRSTLLWSELEPWMDEEYAKQVCGLMSWDPLAIKVPPSASGTEGNNPGYCFLTFPTTAHAASVLAQINGNASTVAPVTMPNSSKPFVLNWASSVPTTTTPTNTNFSAFPYPAVAATATSAVPSSATQYPREHSIFVGDLAPETSNSDLVAVFRNPVLGLRNDREPKFIRPFLSCKSAKIMLDPVTGVSRGYGFVRFTDELDQQRALIEMHGLYCLSRPMRISPATAKFKPPAAMAVPQHELPMVQQQQYQQSAAPAPFVPQYTGDSNTHAPALLHPTQTKSVSAPIAADAQQNVASPLGGADSSNSINSNGSMSSLSTTNSASTAASSASSSSAPFSSDDLLNLPNTILVQIAQQFASGNGSVDIKSIIAQAQAASNGGDNSSRLSQSQSSQPQPQQQLPIQPQPIQAQELTDPNSNNAGLPRYLLSPSSWKHHAQARAILGNLIGPNGEQLTSTDPYNTTVFVGGLSPLVGEETLRTFFVPFGEIHYVKVPVGKHCGFVQFVRKADAERAIEKMQGFPVGGSRIRLSWGRSQYKAAQAAAQAAQAAAIQTQYPALSAVAAAPAPPNPNIQMQTQQQQPHSLNDIIASMTSTGMSNSGGLTQEQAFQLLQKFSMQQGYQHQPVPGTMMEELNMPHPNTGGMFGAIGIQGGVYGAMGGIEKLAMRDHHESMAPMPYEAYAAAYGSQAQQQQQMQMQPMQMHARPSSNPSLNNSPPNNSSNNNSGLSQQQQRSIPSSFSPFSPDPNGFMSAMPTGDILKHRDSVTNASLPHPSKAYAPGFYPQLQTDVSVNTTGKISPTTSNRPQSASRYGSFLDSQQQQSSVSSSNGASPYNRAPSRSSSGTGVSMNTWGGDVMQDLNGTLASLDLDHNSHHAHTNQWKSPTNSTDSAVRRTPSPL